MLGDNSVTDAEAQTRSLPHWLSGVKRIKNTRRILHAGATIGEFDKQLLVLFACGDPKISFGRFFKDGVHGVIDHVKKDLLKLVWVSSGGGQIRGEVEMNTDVVHAKVVVAKSERIFHDFV